MSVVVQPVALRLLQRQAPAFAPRSSSAFVSSKRAFTPGAHTRAVHQHGHVAPLGFTEPRSTPVAAFAAAFVASRASLFGRGIATLPTTHRVLRARTFATATTAMASSHDARLVTYNVLSSSLCEPTYFTHCAPEDLDPDNRYKKLLVKLEAEIAAGAVIGLQEVSQQWAGRLHVFFAERGYHLVCSLYGKPFNGYMGIALAVPLGTYDVTKVDISRCSDTKKLPREPKPSGVKKFIATWMEKITGKRPPQTDWQLARNRFNTIMYASLKCKTSGVEFGVANYHMPCMFRNPGVMTIHSQLAAAYAQRMAGDLPNVLMGDFNLKPGDGGYDLITTGDIPSTHASAPVAPEGETWDTALRYPMRSAYKVALGTEPDFTNHARIKDDEPFVDTLDYIFVSPTVTVKEVAQLPHRDDVKGPFPSKTEPSDHILLQATLTVPGR